MARMVTFRLNRECRDIAVNPATVLYVSHYETRRVVAAFRQGIVRTRPWRAERGCAKTRGPRWATARRRCRRANRNCARTEVTPHTVATMVGRADAAWMSLIRIDKKGPATAGPSWHGEWRQRLTASGDVSAGILDVPDRLTTCTLGLVGLAFGLQLLVAGHVADRILHGALGLVDRALDVFLVHIGLL